MGKQSRKRQKTSKKGAIQPLGSRTFGDDTNKDDEERRLESVLFGVPYVTSGENKGKGRGDDAATAAVVISDDEDGAAGANLKELENMLDSDVRRPLFDGI
jgi:U3 small nucleolar RNA-associated protein 18